MKKIIISLLLIGIIFFGLVGCNKNKNVQEIASENKPENNDLVLDRSGVFNKITYKCSGYSSIKNSGDYILLDVMDNDELFVKISMSLFSNKTIDEVLQGTDLSSMGTLTYNGVVWNVYEGKLEDGKSQMSYLTLNGDDVYSISFVSDKNMDEFISSYMGNILFGE